jgi:hypothetical protein
MINTTGSIESNEPHQLEFSKNNKKFIYGTVGNDQINNKWFNADEYWGNGGNDVFNLVPNHNPNANIKDFNNQSEDKIKLTLVSVSGVNRSDYIYSISQENNTPRIKFGIKTATNKDPEHNNSLTWVEGGVGFEGLEDALEYFKSGQKQDIFIKN